LFEEDEEFWAYFQTVLLKNNLTLKSINDIAKLVNKKPGNNNKIPENKYTILRLFLRKNNFRLHMHILCGDCHTYSSCDNIKSVNCHQCHKELKSTKNPYFLYIGVEQQIKKIIKENIVDIISFLSKKNNDIISDITDGNILNSLNAPQFNENETMNLSVTMNTDGASLSKSNKRSLWPIHLALNFLPPQLRYNQSNILVISLYIGNSKPNMAEYLKPMINEFKYLAENSIHIDCGKKSFTFKLYLTQCSLDMPAKASIMNMLQYNGYNGCPICLHPGKLIPNKKKRGSTVRYTYPHNVYELRETQKTLEILESFVENENRVEYCYLATLS
jgi:hypothetical protein